MTLLCDLEMLVALYLMRGGGVGVEGVNPAKIQGVVKKKEPAEETSVK